MTHTLATDGTILSIDHEGFWVGVNLYANDNKRIYKAMEETNGDT